MQEGSAGRALTDLQLKVAKEKAMEELEKAKEILSGAVRGELRDHAFGDAEVTWRIGDKEIAGGYFGWEASVWVNPDPPNGAHYSFKGDAARYLRQFGSNGGVTRNDSTGPDEYKEGVIMEGLTKEAVRKELEG